MRFGLTLIKVIKFKLGEDVIYVIVENFYLYFKFKKKSEYIKKTVVFFFIIIM